VARGAIEEPIRAHFKTELACRASKSLMASGGGGVGCDRSENEGASEDRGELYGIYGEVIFHGAFLSVRRLAPGLGYVLVLFRFWQLPFLIMG